MGFQCRKRHLARINSFMNFQMRALLFQCRKRHLARINDGELIGSYLTKVSMPQAALGAHQLLDNGVDTAQAESFNAASGTWRASTARYSVNLECPSFGFNAASGTWRASTVLPVPENESTDVSMPQAALGAHQQYHV